MSEKRIGVFQLFRAMDTDRSNGIDAQELYNTLQSIGARNEFSI